MKYLFALVLCVALVLSLGTTGGPLSPDTVALHAPPPALVHLLSAQPVLLGGAGGGGAECDDCANCFPWCRQNCNELCEENEECGQEYYPPDECRPDGYHCRCWNIMN